MISKLPWCVLAATLMALMPTGVLRSQSYQCHPGTIHDISWLLGAWKSERPGGKTSYEVWKQRDSETLDGLSYRVSGTDTLVTEHIAIRQLGNCLIYLAAPRGQQPTAFTLVAVKDGEWIFENSEHDFPTRVIYPEPKSDLLQPRIEGRIKGQNQTVPFTLRRVSGP